MVDDCNSNMGGATTTTTVTNVTYVQQPVQPYGQPQQQ